MIQLNKIKYLIDGNQRFMKNRTYPKKYSVNDKLDLSKSQDPFVAIVTCSDSRVSPETIFDLDLGEAFVIRNAGNIAEIETLSSISYAVDILKIDLIVVLGHSDCGAIQGAVSQQNFPEPLNRVINTIRGRINGEKDNYQATLKNLNVTKQSVTSLAQYLSKKVNVVGAYYDIATGAVNFNI
ncbi:MAG TPA: carbonic anhydrase [Erysipelothrix sp.]